MVSVSTFQTAPLSRLKLLVLSISDAGIGGGEGQRGGICLSISAKFNVMPVRVDG